MNGASQAGDSIITDGWANSTKILSAGDFFAIENRPYMVLSDVTTNGSGQATIDIWPHARTPADNALIVVSDWVGIFELVDDEQNILELSRAGGLSPVTFVAEEAL